MPADDFQPFFAQATLDEMAVGHVRLLPPERTGYRACRSAHGSAFDSRFEYALHSAPVDHRAHGTDGSPDGGTAGRASSDRAVVFLGG